MRKIIALLSFTLLFLPLSSTALQKGGVNMPDQLQAGDTTLVLNGAGIRSKFIFDLYVAGLYLKEKSSDAKTIINADEPMAIRLHIISSKITSKKMSKATREGFEKSTDGNTTPISSEIDQFIAAFSEPIEEGDIFEFIYLPGEGIKVIKNGKEITTIASLEFKKALFGIWLSDDPVQGKLKRAMLGE